MMIVDRVRQAVGRDYMLDMRISGEEHIEGGMEIDEVAEFIKRIEDKIDMVHISCGVEIDNRRSMVGEKSMGRPIGRYCSVYQMHELL